MAINHLLKQGVTASRQLITLSDEAINRILTETADELMNRQAEVLAANEKDLARMDPANPKYDRLKLTTDRLAGIAGDMRNVASLPSPLGKVISDSSYLRSTSECDFRCILFMFQKCKRLCTKGRFGCRRLQSCTGDYHSCRIGTPRYRPGRLYFITSRTGSDNGTVECRRPGRPYHSPRQ